MPGGVFKPYAGVSTAVLVFTRTDTGGTDKVWFYDMRADGYSLDDKRTATGPDFEKFTDLERLIAQHQETPITTTDIPDILSRWRNPAHEATRARTDQSFMVPVDDIRANAYDLSINRYKEVVYAQKHYDTPASILDQINALDAERQADLRELTRMLTEDVAV